MSKSLKELQTLLNSKKTYTIKPIIADFASVDAFASSDYNPIKNNKDDYSITTIGGTMSGYFHGVLAPNGFIYCIPLNATNGILKINANAGGGVSLISSLVGQSGWRCGVLAPNGCIYMIPEEAQSLIKVNTLDDSITVIENSTNDSTYTGSTKWSGGVLAPNGCIYGIPNADTRILKINTTNDTVTKFGSIDKTYFGCVLAQNGKIYGIPTGKNTGILEIDPSNDTYTEFGIGQIPGGSVKGGVLAPDGNIYLIPNNVTTAYYFNPITKVFGSYTVNANQNNGGIIDIRGMIVCGSNSNPIQIIDPKTKTASVGRGNLGGKGCPVMDLNGKIWMMPYLVSEIIFLEMGFERTNWALSPIVNHF